MTKYLIIQTAFIGDVILATALIESIFKKDKSAKIDFLLRKGNESLLKDHPHVNKVLIWNKSEKKYKNLNTLAKQIKRSKYDVLINLQRFGSSGFLSWKSKARTIVGFNKNPFSFCYTYKVKHTIGDGRHEVDRNHDLLEVLGDFSPSKPKLYPSDKQKNRVDNLLSDSKFVVMAPSSVWFTKQLPKIKWIELMNQHNDKVIFLIGGPSDESYLSEIGNGSKSVSWKNLAGTLGLIESAYLISKAEMTYVNDSAPLHLASAMNAPVTVYFCSTIPNFGFGPLSDQSTVVQIEENLSCRPCGLHGKTSCPKYHFDCGLKIDVTLLK